MYYYIHKTAAPIREALFLRPIKNSRIRGKAQFREHRLRTNKVVHVCRKCAVSQRFMEEIHLCAVLCTDFATSLKTILHFGSCSRLFTKHRPITYTVFCDWVSGRLYQSMRPIRTTLILAVRQIHVANVFLDSRVMSVFPFIVTLLNSK